MPSSSTTRLPARIWKTAAVFADSLKRTFHRVRAVRFSGGIATCNKHLPGDLEEWDPWTPFNGDYLRQSGASSKAVAYMMGG